MKERMLRDIEVSEVGMGCMAFSHGYGQIPPEKYSIEAIRNQIILLFPQQYIMRHTSYC